MGEDVLLIDATKVNISEYHKLLEQETTESATAYRNSSQHVWSDDVRERIAVVGAIMVCTIVGNSLLMFMLMCKRSRRIKRVNVFLVNLAIGDLAVALITNSTEILFLAFDDWAVLGPVLCKLSVYLQIVTLASATFLLTAMSVDRYQVIVKPMQSLANRPRIWLKVTIAWIMAFLFGTPQLAIFVQVEKGLKYDGTKKYECLSRGYTETWQRKFYFTFLTTYILILPAVVMLYCYSKIIRVVWSRAKGEERHPPRPPLGDEGPESPRMSIRRGLVTASKRRVIIMTLTVIVGFLFCLTPYFIVNLIRIYSDYKIKMKVALVISENIFMTHSALNPLLYGLFTLRLEHFKRWLACCKSEHKHSRKSSEKNRLINGGNYKKYRRTALHFKQRVKGSGLKSRLRHVALDKESKGMHALAAVNKRKALPTTKGGCTNSYVDAHVLCDSTLRKYSSSELWMPASDLASDECLSTV